jgi:hypothetical protein
LLVGKYKDIYKILNESRNLINIYKCCIITDISNDNFKKIRNEIKIPIFNLDEDIRSILEYHFLGQVWILDNCYSKKILDDMKYFVIKYSVDILIVKIDKVSNKINIDLINDRYEYIAYEISRFYGLSLLIKLILDKILSIFF